MVIWRDERAMEREKRCGRNEGKKVKEEEEKNERNQTGVGKGRKK